MILDDMRHAIRSIRHLLRVRDLCVRLLVNFERRFEIAVIVGGVNGRKIELDDELMKLRFGDAIRSDFPVSIQPTS